MLIRAITICVLFAIAAFAQGERGTFNGTITDPSGAAVAGSTVKVINPETGVETTSVATDAGVYRMPYLQPGTYRITVSAPGFKTAVRQNVVLAVAQTLTIDFALELGNVADQITVSAETPLLETGTAEIGSYVSKKNSIPGRSPSVAAAGRSSNSSLLPCPARQAAHGRDPLMVAKIIRTRS